MWNGDSFLIVYFEKNSEETNPKLNYENIETAVHIMSTSKI